MITKEKIDIYNLFKGDIDGWARSGTNKQKEVMKDKDWFVIERFVQDIGLVKKGLASERYTEDINKRLNENCDSQETIQELKAIV